MPKGKRGGRQKGSINKRTKLVEEIAARFKLDPFEVLMMVSNGDWKGLGYPAQSKVSYSPAGIEFEEDYIKLSDRVAASKDAAKYLHSPKQAIDPSTGDTSIRVVVEDYLSKAAK